MNNAQSPSSTNNTRPENPAQTKQAIIDAFKAKLEEDILAVATTEAELTTSIQDQDEISADRLMDKREEMMDDVELHNQVQQNAQDRLYALNAINASQEMETVQIGALVGTSMGTLLVAAAVESIEFEGQQIRAVSMLAPLMQAMEGNAAGDTIEFNGQHIAIDWVC
jgi:DNA-nicking Smr family endonuclease